MTAIEIANSMLGRGGGDFFSATSPLFTIIPVPLKASKKRSQTEFYSFETALPDYNSDITFRFTNQQIEKFKSYRFVYLATRLLTNCGIADSRQAEYQGLKIVNHTPIMDSIYWWLECIEDEFKRCIEICGYEGRTDICNCFIEALLNIQDVETSVKAWALTKRKVGCDPNELEDL